MRVCVCPWLMWIPDIFHYPVRYNIVTDKAVTWQTSQSERLLPSGSQDLITHRSEQGAAATMCSYHEASRDASQRRWTSKCAIYISAVQLTAGGHVDALHESHHSWKQMSCCRSATASAMWLSSGPFLRTWELCMVSFAKCHWKRSAHEINSVKSDFFKHYKRMVTFKALLNVKPLLNRCMVNVAFKGRILWHPQRNAEWSSQFD